MKENALYFVNIKFQTEQEVRHTTRKSTKTNRITDGMFSSIIFSNENNSVSNFIGIYRQTISVGNTVSIYWWMYSVGTDRIADRLYRFLKSCNGVMTWIFLKWFYRWNDRGIQTGISIQWCSTFTGRLSNGTCPSLIPSVKTNIYPLCWLSLPLFLFLLPLLLLHPNSPLPNCSQQPIQLCFLSRNASMDKPML